MLATQPDFQFQLFHFHPKLTATTAFDEPMANGSVPAPLTSADPRVPMAITKAMSMHCDAPAPMSTPRPAAGAVGEHPQTTAAQRTKMLIAQDDDDDDDFAISHYISHGRDPRQQLQSPSGQLGQHQQPGQPQHQQHRHTTLSLSPPTLQLSPPTSKQARSATSAVSGDTAVAAQSPYSTHSATPSAPVYSYPRFGRSATGTMAPRPQPQAPYSSHQHTQQAQSPPTDAPYLSTPTTPPLSSTYSASSFESSFTSASSFNSGLTSATSLDSSQASAPPFSVGITESYNPSASSPMGPGFAPGILGPSSFEMMATPGGGAVAGLGDTGMGSFDFAPSFGSESAPAYFEFNSEKKGQRQQQGGQERRQQQPQQQTRQLQQSRRGQVLSLSPTGRTQQQQQQQHPQHHQSLPLQLHPHQSQQQQSQPKSLQRSPQQQQQQNCQITSAPQRAQSQPQPQPYPLPHPASSQSPSQMPTSMLQNHEAQMQPSHMSGHVHVHPRSQQQVPESMGDELGRGRGHVNVEQSLDQRSQTQSRNQNQNQTQTRQTGGLAPGEGGFVGGQMRQGQSQGHQQRPQEGRPMLPLQLQRGGHGQQGDVRQMQQQQQQARVRPQAQKRQPQVQGQHQQTGDEPKELKRPTGACTRCKKMKMKCVFPTPASNQENAQQQSCQRCLAGKYPCVVEGRKPRTPSRREWLLAQIRQKDAQIATLLKAHRPSQDTYTPLTLAGGKLVATLGSNSFDRNTPGGESLTHTDRAALLAAEKGSTLAAGGHGASWLAANALNSSMHSNGAESGAGTGGKYRPKMKERRWGAGGVKGDDGGKGDGESDFSDEDWSSDGSEGSDAWDEEVEAALLRTDAVNAKFNAFVLASGGYSGEAQGASAAATGGQIEGSPARGTNATVTAMPPLQLHSLPPRTAPLGLIARLSLEESEVTLLGTQKSQKRPGKGVKRGLGDEEGEEIEIEEGGEGAVDGEASDDSEGWGIANKAYFQPGPTSNLALRRVLNERETPPPIIASGLVSWAEAGELFSIFYESVSPFVSVLDPVLHTVSSVYERCPFLFTVVLAISSRYLPSRPGLHKIAMHFAKTSAATAFIDGVKSVEAAQAYLLMSVYGLPARRWEEDRSWFYGGLASRIATDLGLNRASSTKPLSERHERELLNRVRTWLNCFNVDRSSSTQWGKPTSLWEDETIRTAKAWYRRSRYNHPHDVHLVAYTELLRILSRFHEQVYSDPKAPNGLNKNCNFKAITEQTEAEIEAWRDEVQWSYANESDPNDPRCVFRTKGVPVFENYMRLVMYAFGFESAWKRRRVEPGDMFFVKCLQSATAVVRHLIEVYVPTGYLKYAPDCYFVMGGFCCAFLLKMLRPEFATLLGEDQRIQNVALVTRFVEVLASSDASIDETHTPKLYAKFLHGQLRHVTVTTHQDAAAAAAATAHARTTSIPSAPPSMSISHHRQDSSLLSMTSSPETLPSDSGAPEPIPTAFLDIPPPPFSRLTPGAHSHSSMSSAGSSVPTPGPDQENDVAGHGWLDSSTEGGSRRGCGSGSGSAGGSVVGSGSIGGETMATAGGVADDPMELCEDEFLATMQAISSDQWLNSVLMPGFRWPAEEPMPLGQQGELIFGGAA